MRALVCALGLRAGAEKRFQMANIRVARVVLVLHLLCAKRIFWTMEQPLNSLLQEHPRFQQRRA